MAYIDRQKNYKNLEATRNTKILTFITGDRPQLETHIHPEVMNMLVHHLDTIGNTKKISLYLYTRGGDTLTAWSIAGLLHQYCEEYEVIIPSKALSAGTLLCLGASNLVMTKQATLGPIDPSITTPLNPQIPGAPTHIRFPVSVEAINGFFDLATSIGIKDQEYITKLFERLTENIHPIVLGQVFRTRGQIRMIGKRLLNHHFTDDEKIDKVLDFLCSASGSHDYTIYRREAKDELSLPVENVNVTDYKYIKEIYDDFSKELQLSEHYNPDSMLGTNEKLDYELHRALIESSNGGSHTYKSSGTFFRKVYQGENGMPQSGIEDQRIFEGWKYEN